MPKEALSDRRQRLEAATKALSKNGKSSKLPKMTSERNYQEFQGGGGGFCFKAGAPGQPPPGLATSQGSSDQISMNCVGVSLFPGSISVPTVQVPSSPSSSAPATPATPSTVTSANESGGDAKLGTASSLLGKRDGKEFGARADVKKQKLGEQGKVEKYHQQQQKTQNAKQLKDLQRKQQQFIQQQRSTDSTSQKQIAQLVSQTQQSSQEALSRSDMKAYGSVDQDQLDFTTAELEVSKPIQEAEQLKQEEPDQLGQEWDKIDADVKDEPVLQEHLSHSDMLDGSPLTQRTLHPRQFGMPGQPLLWQHVGLETKSNMKLEKDALQEDLFVDQKRINPIMKPQMMLPAGMKYDSLTSAGSPLVGVPPGLGMGSMGPVPTMSSPGPPKSPQVGTPSFSSPGGVGQLDPMLQSPQYSALNAQAFRRRSNSLPKIHAAPSPNSLSNSMPSPMVNSPSTGSGPLSSPNVKGEPGLAIQSASQSGMGSSLVTKKPGGENETAMVQARQASLVEILHRYRLPLELAYHSLADCLLVQIDVM